MHNFWGVKPLNIKRKTFQLNIDTDRDGVPDWKDCQWWNPNRQHLSPRRKAEINALPIEVAIYPDEPILHFTGENVAESEREEPETVPLASKEAKEKAPETVAQVYSTFNRHPELITRVKTVHKTWQEKPREEYQSLQLKSGKSKPLVEKPKEMVRVGLYPETSSLAYSEGGRVTLGTMPFGFSPEVAERVLISKIDYPVKPQDVAADVIHHELTHEEDVLKDPKMYQKYNRYMDKNMRRNLPNPYTELFEKESKTGKRPSKEEEWEAEKILRQQEPILAERYRYNPYETHADLVAKEQIDKRLKKVSEEEVMEGFRNVVE